MSKVLAVIRREYLIRVKKRSFLVLTLLGPVLIMAIYSLPVLFMSLSGGDQTLAVADLGGGMLDRFRSELAERNRLVPEQGESDAGAGIRVDRTRYRIIDATRPGETVDQARARLNEGLAGEELDAYLIIGEDPDGEGQILYGSRSSSGFPDALDRALTRAAIAHRSQAQGLGLDPEALDELTRSVAVTPVRVSKSGEELASGEGQQVAALGLAWGLNFLFYLTFLIWGTTIMRGVIEEKSSRIMEVMLASVTPTQFMVGKVTGIGLVALTQLAVWSTCAVIATMWGVTAAPQIAELAAGVNPAMFGWFMLLFLLGFAVYALLFAAVGSMCTTDQESQQAAQPVMLCIVAAFFALFAVMRAPDSTFAVVASMIPLTSPLVMLMRLGITEVPTWQIGLSLLILLAGIVAAAWLAARIFRVGTLMYGKRPTIPEIWRWIRVAR